MDVKSSHTMLTNVPCLHIEGLCVAVVEVVRELTEEVQLGVAEWLIIRGFKPCRNPTIFGGAGPIISHALHIYQIEKSALL